MNYKPLPIGVDDFEKLIVNGYYYVDKTLLIKELLDKKGMVNLFTRPRRFGKTLNMSMLQYFFEDVKTIDHNLNEYSYLFDGLNIKQTSENYLSHMGKYPVINLSLKSAKQPNWNSAFHKLRRELASEFRRHDIILENDNLTQSEKERYIKIRDEEADYDDCSDALKFLSQCLKKGYGRNSILLIDEYDVPLENSYERGFYTEMTDFIRSLFESALKTNTNLEFAVITGCLRISEEAPSSLGSKRPRQVSEVGFPTKLEKTSLSTQCHSIFTGMNNLEIISILNKQYDEYFGFTEEEVQKICQDHQLTQRYDTLKEWYNGYIFGEENVYNPWSVIRFIKDLKEDENQYPSSYWANTSSNSIVRKLIERADEDVKGEIEALIEGKTLVKPIHEDITYDEVDKNMDNLWNFMFFTGYFRKVQAWMDEKTHQQFIELAIPNEEVRYIFRNKILTWFQEKVEERDRTRLFQAIIDKDPQTVEEELSEMLLETISFNDAYESFYHGFIAGILTGMKGYMIKSNREGGKGRSDIFIKPVTRRKAAYVIEFKIAKKFNQLDERADDALQQIEDKGYAKELQDDGYESVIKYGISFLGKDCMVKMKE